MTHIRSWIERRGRALGPPLDRLHHALDGLAARLREGLATSLARAIAEAVQEAVHHLLEDDRTEHRAPPAGQWQRYPTSNRWEQERNDYEYDPWRVDEEPIEDRWEAAPYQARPQPSETKPHWWAQALALGLQTAAWWLRNRPGPLVVLVVLALGVLVTFSLGVAPAAGMAGSALALMRLGNVLSMLTRLLC